MAGIAQIEASLTNVGGDIINAGQQFTRAKSLILQAQASMTGLGTTYAEILAGIDDGLTGDPTNPAWLNLDARKTLLVAEVVSLKSDLDAAVAALGI